MSFETRLGEASYCTLTLRSKEMFPNVIHYSETVHVCSMHACRLGGCTSGKKSGGDILWTKKNRMCLDQLARVEEVAVGRTGELHICGSGNWAHPALRKDG